MTIGLTAHAVFAQSYNVTEVDSAHQTHAYAINDSGYTVGSTHSSIYGNNRASYGNTILGVVGHISDLRSGSGSSLGSQIGDVNAGGLGVGYIAEGAPSHAITASVFTYDQRTIPIGALPGDTSSVAKAVNDAGWVVGYSYGNISGRVRAFLWVPDGGDVTRTGATYELPCSEGDANAVSINRDGLIGGTCNNRPYLWAYGVGYDITSWLPSRVDIGHGFVERTSVNLEYCEVNSIANSYAFSVHCTGQLSGMIPPPYADISFVSTPASPALTQVPALGGYLDSSNQVWIMSINDSGCAVGMGSTSTSSVAIKYCDGVVTDLNTVVMADGMNYLLVANDINNVGQILTQKTSSSGGILSPVVLTPR